MKELWDIFTDYFGTTVFHPQFLMKRLTRQGVIEAKKYAKGAKLVDLGCGRMPYRGELEKVIASYTGIDHPKISSLYARALKPDILADITKPPLPVPPNTFDVGLLLEVLEYLEDPLVALKEAGRILKPGGVLVITSPFLYPLHDAPYDRNRFSKTALESLISKSGYKIIKIKGMGNFFDFIFLNFLVFIFKNIQKSHFYILTPLVLTFTTPLNIVAVVLSKLFDGLPANRDYPLSYLVVARAIKSS